MTFNQAYAPKLRQRSQLLDTLIRDTIAACQVDVPDSIAALDEFFHGIVGDLVAPPKVNVMQIPSQLGDCMYGSIGNLAAFGQYQDPKSGSAVDNPLYSRVCQ